MALKVMDLKKGALKATTIRDRGTKLNVLSAWTTVSGRLAF
jgi:hypothetical protein